jgi:hypothetical protein
VTFLGHGSSPFSKGELLFGHKMPLFDYFAKSSSAFAKVALLCAFTAKQELLALIG